MSTSGLYGQATNVGGTYFEWFIFQQTASVPATPIGGSWNFSTNVGVPPTPWSNTPPGTTSTPTWVTLCVVDSRNPTTFNWATPTVWAIAQVGSGTVVSSGFTNANGFTGSVANPSSTPNLTLSTSVTGMIKGAASALTAATAGTDYSAGTSGLATGIVKNTTGTGALSIAVAGDFPTLNQNTTGTASNVTGTVAIANGGTGSSTAQNALIALGSLSVTGADAVIPARSTAARTPSPVAGNLGFNTTTGTFEGFNGTLWGSLASGSGSGGAVGGGADALFYENDQLVTTPFIIGQDALGTCTITISAPCVITQNNSYVANQPVMFNTTGTLPTGLSPLTKYYVIASGLSSTSFQVSATLGGSAVNTSGSQSGVQYCGKQKSANYVGPLIVNSGVTVTIPGGSRLTIQ